MFCKFVKLELDKKMINAIVMLKLRGLHNDL